MLPHFLPSHLAYAKCAHLHLQQISTLEEKISLDEFEAFSSRGCFTFRWTDKMWAGIWTEQCQCGQEYGQNSANVGRNMDRTGANVGRNMDRTVPMWAGIWTEQCQCGQEYGQNSANVGRNMDRTGANVGRNMDRTGANVGRNMERTGANVGNENLRRSQQRSWYDRECYQSLGVWHVRLQWDYSTRWNSLWHSLYHQWATYRVLPIAWCCGWKYDKLWFCTQSWYSHNAENCG